MLDPSRRYGLASVAIALLCGTTAAANAQPATQAARRAITATRTSEAPVIDGLLNDECWSRAEPASSFTQRDPDEGRPPTERTEIRILYDNDALYVAARLFDTRPDLVVRRLSNRDGDADADRVVVYLDSMHDGLTGAAFAVTASNVQKDTVLFNDTFQESSWDAVWLSQVSVDAEGWSAEIRIPLSQLRFPLVDRHTWGINVERFIHRKNETVWLEMVPKNEAGLVSRMIDLTGLDGLRPRRHLELLPYTTARAEFITPDDADDPFNDGARGLVSAGMDLKWGITSNLVLDGTINPDFGQVEVDPAVVNLTAFETFFPEKRAFFLEGAQIFSNYGQGGSNSFWGFNTSDPNIFYSRRIGRSPQVDPDGDFVDSPPSTTILGAAKLTGKTQGGWTIGLLEAVTDRETARVRSTGITGSADVEPLTSYTVARVQRELGRRLGIGFITTATLRRLDTDSLRDALAQQAYVLGTDGYVFVDDRRDWVVTGKISRSRVSGSTAAVDDLQHAAQRYYQRPDAPHLTLDPHRTSLGGWAGRVNLNRNSGLWQVNAALWGASPGFESNDLGFHGTGDRAGGHVVSIWRGVTPNRFSRSRTVWVAKAWTWNYGRDLQHDSWHGRASATFLNYWNVSVGGLVWRRALDDRLTRGGPSTASPAGFSWNINGGTDARQRVSLQANVEVAGHDEGDSKRSVRLTMNVKPSSTVTLSTGPEWTRSTTAAQYVTDSTDPTAVSTYGSRYVFGAIRQTQLSMTTRLSVIVTPRVSMQVFAQPLLAVGDYTGFKELARPRTFEFLEYGKTIGAITRDVMSNEYTVDPDITRNDDPVFSFDDPDFNLKSLKLNAVFRWEMKPGSNMYVVWTRQQVDETNPGRFALGHDARRLFAAAADDVVMVKISYWIGR